MNTGPDIAEVECYSPTGCCPTDPCTLDKQQFIYSIRALLPPSPIFNNLVCEPVKPQTPTGSGVGCFQVGCGQLVYGACCEDRPECFDYGQYPQLAVFDAFAAGFFDAVYATCQMLKELSPCTAEVTVQRWALRYGLLPDTTCANLTDEQLKALTCAMYMLRLNPSTNNMSKIQALAGMFGAELELTYAGDFSDCAPYPGWWTMAREGCPLPPQPLPTQCGGAPLQVKNYLTLSNQCADSVPPSINIILRETDIHVEGNCNTDAVDLPHDDDLYEAFKLLLPSLLPQTASICIYEPVGDEDCDFTPVLTGAMNYDRLVS